MDAIIAVQENKITVQKNKILSNIPPDTSISRPTRQEAEAAVRTLLLWAGENPEREGLIDTPSRVVKTYEEIYGGYRINPEDVLERVFEEVAGYDDIVLLRDIAFYSHCEHHLVPVIGRAHIAYYPRNGVVGLSKLARIVDVFARRMQTQEAMTAQIATTIDEGLNPLGLAVMIEAEHLCMAMRGIQKQGVSTITTKFMGKFKQDPSEQVRFMSLIRYQSA